MKQRWLQRIGLSAALVAGVSVCVQVIHLAWADHDPTFETPIVDAAVYHKAAVAFSRGEPLIDDAFWQPPLFPVVLGSIYRVFGARILFAKVVLALIAVGTCLLVFDLGRRLFSPSVGLIAGLIASFYGPFVFYSTRLLPTGPAVFLDVLALVLWVRCLHESRWDRWLAFGLVTGLATITVPNAFVLLVLALVGLAYGHIRRGCVLRMIVPCGLVVAGAALPIGAVTVRNYIVSGEWVLISTNGGINFYVGNNPHREETIAIRPGEPWKRFARQSYLHGARTRAEQSSYFFRRGVSEIAADPIEFVRGLCRKAARVINGREIPRNVDPYLFRDFSWPLFLMLWRVGTFSFPFGLLAPLAVVGLIHSLTVNAVDERMRRGRIALLAFVVAYGASVVLFFISGRYRLPAAMAAIVFAAAGAVALWSNIRACIFSRGASAAERAAAVPARRRGLITFVVFLVAAVGVNLPMRAPTDGVNFRAELNVFVGFERAVRGDLADAEAYVRRALTHEPQNAKGVALLAGMLVNRGEIDQARELLDSALRRNPADTEARLALANQERFEGRLSKAASGFEEVLGFDVTSPEAHAGLADMLVAEDRPAEAIDHYRSALQYGERSGPIELRLADALVQVAEYKEAIERYRRALWTVDADMETLNRVAWLLATCPQPELRDCDQAVRLATEVCQATEYRNTTALDTLAAAHAECGRLDEAISWVRAAIALAQERGDSVAAENFRSRLGLYEDRLKERSGRETAATRAGRSNGE